MKPRRKNDQGKGLARWRWIKSYLGPTLKYIGITSDEFDKIISGGDQHIKQSQEAENKISISSIGITINGAQYVVSGQIPLGDGYICIAFDYEPTTTTIETLAPPESFVFSGVINLLTPPTWIIGNQLNQRAAVNPDGSIDSVGRVIIPVARRIGESLEIYIRSPINFQTFGTLGIDAYLN